MCLTKLTSLVDRLLAKSPEDRPQTPEAVACLLLPFALSTTGAADQLIGQNILTARSVPVESTPEKLGRRDTSAEPRLWAWPWVATSLIAVLLLGAVLLTLNTPHGIITVKLPEGVTRDQLEELKIEFRGNGPVKIADAKHGWTINVDQMGEFSVQLVGGADRFTVENTTVTVTRDEEEFVKVSFLKKSKAASATDYVVPGLIDHPESINGIEYWQVETIAPRFRCDEVAWSPDSQHIAVGSADGIVRVYGPDHLTLTHMLAGHSRAIRALAWRPDSSILASGADYGEMRLWNHDGSLANSWTGHPQSGITLAWHPDGRQLISSGGSFLKSFDLAGQLQKTEPAPSQITGISWSPNKNWFATAHSNREARLWNSNYEMLHVLEGHERELKSVSWHPDSNRFVTTSFDGCYRIWNLDGELISAKRVANFWAFDAQWSPDGSSLAAATMSPGLVLESTDGRPGATGGLDCWQSVETVMEAR